MEIQNLKWCCGAHLLENFHAQNQRRNPDGSRVSKKQWQDNVRTYLQGQRYRYGNHAFSIVILNPAEKQDLHEVFIECGYAVLDEGYNKNSGKTLTLYCSTRKTREQEFEDVKTKNVKNYWDEVGKKQPVPSATTT